MLSANCFLFVKQYYMFVWLQAEQVIICSTLTKRKCDTTPRRHVCVYTAHLHLSEVITILRKSTVKSAARIANVSITRTAQVFTRAHLHYFRLPCVWKTETVELHLWLLRICVLALSFSSSDMQNMPTLQFYFRRHVLFRASRYIAAFSPFKTLCFTAAFLKLFSSGDHFH